MASHFIKLPRLGELVSRLAKSYDSDHTLLVSDVSFNYVSLPGISAVGSYKFKIKNPKVNMIGVGDLVEVFQVDSHLDPVAALSRFLSLLEDRGWKNANEPFFRRDNGLCMTRDHLNQFLKKKLVQ